MHFVSINFILNVPISSSSLGLILSGKALEAIQKYDLLPETLLYLDAYFHVNAGLIRQFEEWESAHELISNSAGATAEQYERWGCSRFRLIVHS